ncbi:hypothetical protein HPB50_006891 [Hyalomma asiaticum]|uniref:Uncharacterized protein n=1 Tax=Hyalomma asiaticum TaxID=266040 RepID=A0ACB7RSD7_HYAAI|nr:hypothetical protein HPB50_006891 [Hyalomma asiaticum]
MPPVVKPARFAHAEGHTDVCYDPTGRYLVTCGSDGEVRTWESFQDDEPKSYSVGESALAVACGGGTFFVATDSYCVKAFAASTGQETSAAVHFPSDVYAVACSSDGKTLVAGSGDFTLKVVDVSSGTTQLLTGHEAPVLCCRIDPRAEFILALPVKSEVRLVPRGSWDQVDVLAHDSVQEALSIVAFSGCGKLLAAATRGGKLLVWDWSARQLMHTVSCGKDICSLSWNPSQKELVYCNTQGQLGLVEGIDSGSTVEQVAPTAVKVLPEDKADAEDDGIDLGQIKATYEPLIFGNSDGEEEDGAPAPSTVPATSVQQEYRPRLMQDAFQPASTPVHLQHRFMVRVVFSLHAA